MIWTARFRSKKINGKFSGVLKDRIVCLRSIIKTLAERVRDTGDVSYLRRRNDELASQLRKSRKEESRLQMYLKESDNKVEKLNLEIAELRKKIGLMTEKSQVGETPPLVNRMRSATPKVKPSMKKETPRRRDEDSTKAPSVVASLQ